MPNPAYAITALYVTERSPMEPSKPKMDGEDVDVRLNGKLTGPSGLTLTESLVTLGLLALVAAGFFGAYRVGVDAGKYAQRLAVVTALGQARLETIRSDPLRIVEISGAPVPLGGFPGVIWWVEVRPVSSDFNQVTIILLWNWRGRSRQTVLTTLVHQTSGK